MCGCVGDGVGLGGGGGGQPFLLFAGCVKVTVIHTISVYHKHDDDETDVLSDLFLHKTHCCLKHLRVPQVVEILTHFA